MFLWEGNFDPADRELSHARRLDPETWKGLVGLARWMIERAGQPDAAVRFIGRAWRHAPDETARDAVEREARDLGIEIEKGG
jgi:hypothetical protein